MRRSWQGKKASLKEPTDEANPVEPSKQREPSKRKAAKPLDPAFAYYQKYETSTFSFSY